MAAVKCIMGLLVLLVVSAWTEAGVVKRASGDQSDEDEGHPTVTQQSEKANSSLHSNPDRPFIVSHHRTLRSIRPCVLRECMWPKSTDGKVYIPYVITNHYSSQELVIIKRGINSFSYSTCIRFFPRTNQRDFLHIQSLDGCYSYVGRQGNGQTLSLSHRGCIYYGTVQHELLHALGFSHEQCRADRDQHIRILAQNILEGEDYNFDKLNTLNQETPYDYGSVMHYSRLAFSRDNYNPTMVAVPDPSAVFGMARKMNQNDINRINLLYCRS
ncbi:high choriolytic enzyme 1-like [Chelmon rostratus]|uniref:high choriolytic enzyme 1-like n=1 Tax=Chelmon rostratus TaxID=109905 RepID=UPI001BE5224C|nr:high choriolytic enzyme 1-like [Chelmon rostratus]